MTVKLIASDMDHTLLNESGQLPPNFEQVVKQLTAKGIIFTAASGRPLYTLKQMFANLENDMCLVGDNGGVISYQGDIIFKSLLPLTDYQRMVAFVNESQTGIGMICGMDAVYIEEQYQALDAIFRQFYAEIKYVPDLTKVSVEADKFTVYFPEANSRDFYEQIYGPTFGADYSVAVAGVEWVDIMNKGIDKGHAMRFLANHFNISTAEMMAFGDTYNDKEMLQTVKYSYLMGNADDDMLQYATYRADTNENYGVLQEIEKLL